MKRRLSSATISTLTNKLGVSESTASFVGSFETTAGMQGCAGIFPALTIICYKYERTNC